MKPSIVSLLFVSGYWIRAASWDYDHQSEWSHDFEMCGTQDQSPIDIQTTQSAVDSDVCNATFEWNIDYTKQTFRILNNGFSLVLYPVISTSDVMNNSDKYRDMFDMTPFTGHDGIGYLPLNTDNHSIATFPNYFKPSSSAHDKFCFHSMHFHWGLTDDTGSEHLMNGYQSPLEAHFVHFSCAHASLTDTLAQFHTIEEIAAAVSDGVDTHQMGVVSILFDAVEHASNPAFDAMFTNGTMDRIQPILLHDPQSGSMPHVPMPSIVKDLDLSTLIPDYISRMGYYAYEGSLTTPPCTNINRWHVMNARGYIGTQQLEMFRQLLFAEGQTVAPNYREVQENVNTVYLCQDPTPNPTSGPTARPTSAPSGQRTLGPTAKPTYDPTHKPSFDPTGKPTISPTSEPTTKPTISPTKEPTAEDEYTDVDPTNGPTIEPTNVPTMNPTSDPLIDPMANRTNKRNYSNIKYFLCIFYTVFVNL